VGTSRQDRKTLISLTALAQLAGDAGGSVVLTDVFGTDQVVVAAAVILTQVAE
jgi:hypothetical protein